MKKLIYFLMIGWLLINFRPAIAQSPSITLQEAWSVTLGAGENCIDVQSMNGYTYDLVYIGSSWDDWYTITKRNAYGMLQASVNKSVQMYGNISMFCYENKVLIAAEGAYNETRLTIYDDNLVLLQDTLFVQGETPVRFFYYDSSLLAIYHENGDVVLKKLDPITFASIDSLTIDSASVDGSTTPIRPGRTPLAYDFFIKEGDHYFLSFEKYLGSSTTAANQGLKINKNLQIVATEPPVLGEEHQRSFSYQGELYYLLYTFGNMKIAKKDTTLFTTNWKVNAPKITGYTNGPNFLNLNGELLYDDGMGYLYQINSATGTTINSNLAITVPFPYSYRHNFGKISCGSEYPFMAIGPSSGNPTLPLRVYLIDPATLDTLSSRLVPGVNHGYFIKEDGDRVYVMGNKIVSLKVLAWPSLRLIAGTSGQDITNSDTIINASSPPAEIVFNDLGSDFWVKNMTGETKQFKCKKIVLNETLGTENYFSWDTIYGVGIISPSNSVAIAPDSSFKGFKSHYLWNGHVGITKIRYVFFNSISPGDSVYYDITYDVLTGLGEQTDTDAEISIFPNPADRQIAIRGLDSPEVEIIDVAGKIVLCASGKLIDVSGLKPGMYLVKIGPKGQKKVLAKKMIKR